MKKIILAILTLSIFAIGADKPTHYINNKWRVCDEMTYDVKGNLVHQRYNWGGEFWHEYDSMNNLQRTLTGDSSIILYDYTYDEQNRVIEHLTYRGDESWTVYDEKGNAIYSKDRDRGISDTRELWNEYDERGQIIHSLRGTGYEFWCEYEYDRYSNPTRDSFIDSDNTIDTLYSYYEYFTSDGKKLTATYDYNRKNPYHIKPFGTVLRCKK